MNASKQALIRHLILSRNFGNFLVSIAFIRVDGFLDSAFNFTRRLMHIGGSNAMMKLMGVQISCFYGCGENIRSRVAHPHGKACTLPNSQTS